MAIYTAKPVSSFIGDVVLDTKKRQMLVVFYKADQAYLYKGVTKKEYNELLTAESPGRYLNDLKFKHPAVQVR